MLTKEITIIDSITAQQLSNRMDIRQSPMDSNFVITRQELLSSKKAN